MRWFVAAAVLLASCDLLTDVLPPNAYRYTSYDASGKEVVKGWFTLRASGPASLTEPCFSGEWHFEPVGAPQQIGPQTGDGRLIGGLDEGGNVWVELHPQFIDNNLQLRGKLEKRRYAGEWTWISLIGITNRGSFKAVRE